MKKVAFKASVVALSTALAVTPMAFAQTPVSQGRVVAAADTQPLPGAKKSSAALGAALGISTAAAVAIVVGVIVAAGFAVNESQKNDDDQLRALLLQATGTTGTVATR